MCVRVQVRLRDPVAGALEGDGDAIYVDGLVTEKVPRDPACPCGGGGSGGPGGSQARRMQGPDQEDSRDAGPGHKDRPDPDRRTEVIPVEEGPQEERTGGPDDILAREDDAIRHGPVAVVEPLAQGQRRRAVDKGTPECRQDSLGGHEVPDVLAEGRQQEADARQGGSAQRGRLAPPSPASRKGGEQKGHGEIHHAVKCRSDYTCEALVALECPVAREVLLEDAVAHGEACSVMLSVELYTLQIITPSYLPHIGS